MAEAVPSPAPGAGIGTSQDAIARASTGTTAFVGRALKGPISQPVAISSFADYQKHFGGLWQPSTMSYAVEQFFDNGGREAIVVRVVNGGRPPSLTLACGGGGALRLVGLVPGSREHLRASVDYDGIDAGDGERFNLVVQRLRGPGSGLVEEQEIYRRLSVRPDGGRYVVDSLAASRLVRVSGGAPAQRPELPPPSAPGSPIGYVYANNDGDDGEPLTDYDVIGSAQDGTGLFALLGARPFNLLCIPPLGRDRDVGASTLLVAARFCRERQALLVLDPPHQWDGPAAALAELRGWPFRSDSAVMYFPRLVALDRLRGRQETFAACGAIAGMLARLDAAHPPWSPAELDEVMLRPGLRPACVVDEADRARLLHEGVNTLATLRIARREAGPARTLAATDAVAGDWRWLAARRTAQFIALSIREGTRWMALERNGPDTWRRARGQVDAFLAGLDAEGAFPERPGEGYFVICDERLNGPEARAAGRISLLFGFSAARPGEFHAFVVTHRGGGSDVRSVSINRQAMAGRRVEEEIETAILRGIAAGG